MEVHVEFQFDNEHKNYSTAVYLNLAKSSYEKVCMRSFNNSNMVENSCLTLLRYVDACLFSYVTTIRTIVYINDLPCYLSNTTLYQG